MTPRPVLVAALGVVALALGIVALIPSSDVGPQPITPGGLESQSDHIRASTKQGAVESDSPPGASTPRVDLAQTSEHDAPVLDEVLFNFSLTEEERTLCSDCDPFLTELDSKLSAEDKSALSRFAQFSNLTKSEAWRLGVANPAFLDDVRSVSPDLIAELASANASFFEAKQAVFDEAIGKGDLGSRVADLPQVPEQDLERGFVVQRFRRDGVDRVLVFYAYEHDNLYRALQRRLAARENLSRIFNGLVSLHVNNR